MQDVIKLIILRSNKRFKEQNQKLELAIDNYDITVENGVNGTFS